MPASSRPGSLARAALRRGGDPASATATATSSTASTRRTLTEHGLRDRRPVARRQVRRDRRAAVASVVRRGAVPPRVQVEAAQAASAVRRLRRGEPPAQARRPPRGSRDVRGRVVGVKPIQIGGADDRRRRPLLLIAGPCVIESEAHAARSGRSRSATSPPRCGVPVRLQGLVRQGQPHLGSARSAGPGSSEGLRDPGGACARRPACRS